MYTVSAQLRSELSSVLMLEKGIGSLVQYLERVSRGDTPTSPHILAAIASLCSRLQPHTSPARDTAVLHVRKLVVSFSLCFLT